MKFLVILLKAQGSVEFVFVLGLVVTFVAALMVVGFRESELSMAVSAGRLAAGEFTIRNPSYVVTSIDYSVDSSNRIVAVYPKINLRNGSAISSTTDNASLVALSVEKLRRVFHPNSTTFSGNCFPASYYTYCVVPRG